jgi:hypothetical protein
MNIPLDRLYDFIENVAEKIYGNCVIIYRFWPHGSKNIETLLSAKHYTWVEQETNPILWCHDQEPLFYDYYASNLKTLFQHKLSPVIKKFSKPIKNLNYRKNIFANGLLLHSEKRSRNLARYEEDNELLSVYYWSHAIIARDWFRYAQHTDFKKNASKTFLIYNRSWTGNREYRLKFADLLVQNNLIEHCRTAFAPQDQDTGCDYQDHQFNNFAWKPQYKLEKYLPVNNATATSSADFNIEDYNSTKIEIVLETLFDDDRLHLTEKILRPIACGQPFVLAATYNSLEYLKEYGFKTFGEIWDESYDQIQDPKIRMEAIIDLMKYISNLQPWQLDAMLQKTKVIVDYNKNLFFSTNFFQYVVDELQLNLQQAFDKLTSESGNPDWMTTWSNIANDPEATYFLDTNTDINFATRGGIEQAMNTARKLGIN